MKRNRFQPRHLYAAFTLLEIMLVVTIIALLAASGIYFMKGNVEYSREVRVKGDLQSISTQLKLYEAMNGFYPSSSQGIAALEVRPTSEPKPRQWRQLLSPLPKDAWNENYEYQFPGKNNPGSFDVYSKGPDRIAGTPDDIGNWEATQQ
jgi:general secretion pathway protein G